MAKGPTFILVSDCSHCGRAIHGYIGLARLQLDRRLYLSDTEISLRDIPDTCGAAWANGECKFKEEGKKIGIKFITKEVPR